MPSLRKTSKLPVAVLKKLKVLDTELEEEDITVKGYCKRKWAILQQYASKNIVKDVKRIHAAIAQKKADEKEAYSKMLDLLRIEHLFINGKLDKSIEKVLGSTENIPQDVDLIKLEYSISVDNTVKNSIINNSQKVDNPIKNILGSTENLPQEIDLTEPSYSTPVDNTPKSSNMSFEKLVYIESTNISKAEKIVENIPVNMYKIKSTKLTNHPKEKIKELSSSKLNINKRKNTRQSTFQNSIIRNFQKLINIEPPIITENLEKNKPVNKNRKKSTEPTVNAQEKTKAKMLEPIEESTTDIHEKAIDKSLKTIEKSPLSDSKINRRKSFDTVTDSCEKIKNEYLETIEESSLTKSKINSEKNTKQITFKTSIIRNFKNIVQIEPPNVPVNKNKRKRTEPSIDSQENTETKKLKTIEEPITDTCENTNNKSLNTFEESAACDIEINKRRSTESVYNFHEKTKNNNLKTIEESSSTNKKKNTRQSTFKTSIIRNFKNIVQIEPPYLPNSQKVVQNEPVNINKQRKNSDIEINKRKSIESVNNSHEKTKDNNLKTIEESSSTNKRKNTRQSTFKTSIIRNFKNIVQIGPPNLPNSQKVVQNEPVNINKQRKSSESIIEFRKKIRARKLRTIIVSSPTKSKINKRKSINLRSDSRDSDKSLIINEECPPINTEIIKSTSNKLTSDSRQKTNDTNLKTIEEPSSPKLEINKKDTRQTTFKTSIIRNFKNIVQIEPPNVPNSQKVVQNEPININIQRKSSESIIEFRKKTRAKKLRISIVSSPTKSKISKRKSTNLNSDSRDSDKSLIINEECPPTNTEIIKRKSNKLTSDSRQKTNDTNPKTIEEPSSPKPEINNRKDTRQTTFKSSIIRNFQKLIQTESPKIENIVQNVPINKNKRKSTEPAIDSQEMTKAKKLKIIEEPTDTQMKTNKLSTPTKSDINKRNITQTTSDFLGRKTNENLKTIEEAPPIKSERNKRKSIETTDSLEKARNKKLDTINESPPNKTKISLPKNSFKPDYCDICNQYLKNPNLLKYKGHPKESVNEFVAVNDQKMLADKENETDNCGQLRHYKITQFSVYDKNNHLCPFDSGLIENNTKLFFSGYLKPINDENTSAKGGVPAKDMGPIKEWWTSGFGGGENAIVGFTTTFGEYYLMEPSNEYKPIMKPAWKKIYLSKILIEFLLKTCWQNPTYKDLLLYLPTCKIPANFDQFTEDDILKHAQFICEQVSSFDAEVKENNLFMSTSCMRSLVESAGVTYMELEEIRKEESTEIKNDEKKEIKEGKKEIKEVKKEIKEAKKEIKEVTKEIKEVKKETKTKKKPRRSKNLSKATTTELVREVFDSFFPEQLDKNKEQIVERKRCGKCKNCKKPDCGKCKNCKEKNKRSRRCKKEGKNNQDCIRRKCPNTKIQTTEDSESDDSLISVSSISPVSSKHIFHSATWLGDPITEQNGRTYYSSAKVGNEIIKPGDHVMLKPDKRGLPLLVAKVTYMWDQITGGKYFHAHIFCRGTDTVLGEIGDRRELFQVDECENCPLGSIVKKAEVEYKLLHPYLSVEDDSKFFCQKRYDRKKGRFEDIFDDKLNDDVCSIILGYKPCASCKRKTEKEKLERPILEEGIIYWRNEHFKIGTGVYLLPGTFEFKTAPVLNSRKKKNDPVDEDIYPEYYRKKSENIIGIEISEPFCIGYITEILTEPTGKQFKAEDIELRVKKLYRPENTHKGVTLSQQLDINIVYWSEEEVTIPFSKITGKCHIIYGDILDVSVEEWCSRGPNRFYFLQSYNSETQAFESVGESGMFVSQQEKTKKSGENNFDVPEEWFSLEEPLKTMDVFAGCGGLSEGLHQSGVADTKWAIENDTTAAQSFKENNRQTIVYSVDCNKLLSQIISGKSKNDKGQPLPRRGDVELMVGGPPCQGFSGMNRFNAGQYSLFKNSLIVSYLSYCDFYRPKFFILENVRNFVTFKRSMVLKLTLRCLLAMGYQCTFGVVQAGNYGVPQIRRRSIIFAAAPGEILPEYPEPLHVFTSKRANPLDIVIDNCRYNTGSKWLDCGAPYRTITVRDAMSDLPQISNGCSTLELSYDSEPLSHFQRVMRGPGDQTILRDHICKEMAPLVEARMSCIPNESGSDWRDLPNIEIQLSDGTMTNKLKYEWNDKRNGKNSKGSNRGVCPCASNRTCDASVRQYNTLIPWCLPHTANRHNNWAGLFGRLDWDGVFNTTVTNPEPIGKQGRVLHPVQNRVVSVRECARSQGFPDKYRFYGNVMDKHRQVGNAVPPPMGKAIGQEILKSVIFNKPKNNNC